MLPGEMVLFCERLFSETSPVEKFGSTFSEKS
jgi:hypothetical protein